MSEIVVSESGRWRVSITFGGGLSADATLDREALTTAEEEALLAWYFDDHVSAPFLNETDAGRAEVVLRDYGQRLFGQLFAQPAALRAFDEYMQRHVDDGAVIVRANAPIHAIRWEALRDPRHPAPLAARVMVVRQNIRARAREPALLNAAALRVLLVTSRPFGARDVAYRTISEPLVRSVLSGDYRWSVDLIRPGTLEALEDHLRATKRKHGPGYYSVLHFDGHGTTMSQAELREKLSVAEASTPVDIASESLPVQKGYLMFESQDSVVPCCVPADYLADTLGQHGIPCAILTACKSSRGIESQVESVAATLVARGVTACVGMRNNVTVTAARVFSEAVYTALADGLSFRVALRGGRAALLQDRRRRGGYGEIVALDDWVVPEAYDCGDVRLLEEQRASLPPRPRPLAQEPDLYGRDADVLRIERAVLSRGQFVLISGMRGMGKTTLARHLAWWWEVTNFVDRCVLFEFGDRRWDADQISDCLAHSILPNDRSNIYDEAHEAGRRSILSEALRDTRLAVIFDSVDQHEIDNDEREPTPEVRHAMQTLISDLLAASAIAVVTSTGDSNWLVGTPPRDMCLELLGLDSEGQMRLAAKCLSTVGKRDLLTRRDPHLLRLLELLGGCPLAIEMSMCELAATPPEKVLQDLEAQGIRFGDHARGGALEKCIRRGVERLDSGVRDALRPLAMFRGFVTRELFLEFSRRVCGLDDSADAPARAWAVARKWGLLSERGLPPGIARVHAALPSSVGAAEPLRGSPPTGAARKFVNMYRTLSLALLVPLESGEGKRGVRAFVKHELENLRAAARISARDNKPAGMIVGVVASELIDRRRWRMAKETAVAGVVELPNDREDHLSNFGLFDLAASACAALRDHKQALSYYARAEEALRDANLPGERERELLKVLRHNRAALERRCGSYKDAESLLRENLEDDPSAELRAKALLELSIVAQHRRDPNEARRLLRDAIAIARHHGMKTSLGSMLHQDATIMFELGEASAESRFREAIRHNASMGLDEDSAPSWYYLGLIAETAGDFVAAEKRFLRSLSLFRGCGAKVDEARIYGALGGVCKASQRWAQGSSYYTKAIGLCGEAEVPVFASHYFSQAYCESRLGNRRKAGQQRRAGFRASRDAADDLRRAEGHLSAVDAAADRNMWRLVGKRIILCIYCASLVTEALVEARSLKAAAKQRAEWIEAHQAIDVRSLAQRVLGLSQRDAETLLSPEDRPHS